MQKRDCFILRDKNRTIEVKKIALCIDEFLLRDREQQKRSKGDINW
jgi:hypothetical protein